MAECHCFARRVKRFGAEDQKRDIGKRCISKGWLLCMGLFSSFYRSGLRRVRPFDKALEKLLFPEWLRRARVRFAELLSRLRVIAA
jgi:hypothetical protein